MGSVNISDSPKSNSNFLLTQLSKKNTNMTVDKINEIKKSNPGNIMAACFDEAYYNSGVQNADSAMGCYAMNPNDYDEFEKFFKPVLEKYHKVDLAAKGHKNNWDLAACDGLPADGKLDVSAFGLAPGHPKQMSEERYQELVKAHIMFKDMAADSYLVNAGIAGDWPHGRGCYVSADKGFIIWCGEEDHLRIMAMKKSVLINDVFDRLKAAIDVVKGLIPGGCAKSEWAGVITSCPTNIGTGMRASVHVALPKLTSDGTDVKAKAICDPFGLSVRGLGGEHTPIGADGTVDISPKARFCISEAEIACALYKGVKSVWEAENKA